MKKFLLLVLSFVLGLTCLGMTACNETEPTLYVYTNSGFAPYEYLNKNGEVIGVDIDIMNEIGEALGYNIVVRDIEFDQILNEVAKDKNAVGAAGMTKKESRDLVATASISYATSVQYIIVPTGTFTSADLVDGKLPLSKLAGKKIGAQVGTTGYYLIDDNIALEDGEYYGTTTTVTTYKNAIVASQDIGTMVDAVIIDKLPAESICASNNNLQCFELDAEPESYVLYLNKEATELLANVNEVLEQLIADGKIAQFTINHSNAAD